MDTEEFRRRELKKKIKNIYDYYKGKNELDKYKLLVQKCEDEDILTIYKYLIEYANHNKDTLATVLHKDYGNYMDEKLNLFIENIGLKKLCKIYLKCKEEDILFDEIVKEIE